MEASMIFLFIIGFISFFGIVSHIQITHRLSSWLKELEDMEKISDPSIIRSRWITRLMDDYKTYHLEGAPQMNTQALIEKHFFKQPVRLLGILKAPVGNIVKLQNQLPSMSIIFGILGTFIGLTMALFSMQETLLSLGGATSEDISVNAIVSSIAAPFQGMSMAFITSIAGIANALLLNALQNGYFNSGRSITYLQGEIMSSCESFLDHDVAAQLENQKPKDYLEKIFDRFVSKVQESFQASVGQFSTEMVKFTDGLESAMNEVRHILESQREYSDAFAKSAESLNGFSTGMAESIQRIHSLKSEADQTVGKLTQGIASLEKQLKQSVERQESGQRRFEQLINRSDQLVKETTGKTQEISSMFAKGLEDTLHRAHDRNEEMERRMMQLNDEWHHRYQGQQDRYHHAAQDFSGSVQHLEKSWFDAIERLKRDVFDRLERDRQMNQRVQSPQDDQREVLRALEMLRDRIGHDSAQVQNYLNELYSLLYRMAEHQFQQTANTERPIRRQPVPTRLPE